MSSIEKFMERMEREKSHQRKTADRPPNVEETGKPDSAIASADGESDRNSVSVDIEKLNALGILTPEASNLQIAEEYRAIKRPILKTAFNSQHHAGESNNLVMLTSSKPGEGKSFTAISLAMSIVMERDYTAMLLEADLAKPSVLDYMGIHNVNSGLGDYLQEDHGDISRYILHTNIPKLTIIPAGKRHTNSHELISSNNMKVLVDELSRRYSDRIIIVDSPPLLNCSDAVILSGLVGQVVLVVEAGKTLQSDVKEAFNLIDERKPVGVILNKNKSNSSSPYGYGYGANA